MRTALIALAITLCAAPLAALDVGEQAPALDGVEFVKQDAKPLEGIVSVVEFWATWCGPCRTSIPHLTKLQDQYGEAIQIIGLSNEDRPTVEPFVEEFGDRMDYAVGIAPADLHQAYMEGVPGIPHAFIVDASGTVVWKGHPMGMDGILASVVDGSFDPAAQAKIDAAQEALEATFRSNDPATIGNANELLLKLDPTNAMGLSVGIQLAMMAESEDDFRNLFTRIPAAELKPAQAADLLLMHLDVDEAAWVQPDLVQALASAAVAGDQPDSEELVAAARAAHFLGDLDLAIERAEAAGADGAGLAELYKEIKALAK